jgi:hypothetical protein
MTTPDITFEADAQKRARRSTTTLGLMQHYRKSSCRLDDPRMRRKSNWRRLSRGEMRLLMAGLADWESRSPLGPIRTRIRKTRLEAVAFFRKHHGSLSEGNSWVSPRLLPKDERRRPISWGPHNPGKENVAGVLWDKT